MSALQGSRLVRFATALAMAVSVGVVAESADASGSVATATVGPFHVQQLSIPAGCTVNAYTSGLSAGSDTVLHVQGPDGRYVAGNDDSGGTVASSVSFYQTTTRTLTFIVRAYGAGMGGTGSLTIQKVGTNCGSPTTMSMSFDAGLLVPIPSIAWGSRLQTVQPPAGLSDSMLLYFRSDPSHLDLFDDDSGMNRSAFMEIPYDLPGNTAAFAVVGGYYSSGRVKFVRDDSAGFADPDGDGLGNSLEAFIGTNPNLADTDNDGLSDSLELYGADDELLRYPAYGADPIYKDLFLEADWRECGTDPADQCAPSGGTINLDLFRLSGQQITEMSAVLASAGIQLHADIGLAPPVGSADEYLGTYGAWGGAARFAGKVPGNHCAYMANPRVTGAAGAFHGQLISSGDRGASQVAVRCSSAGQNARANAHEIGHSLGVEHEGYRVRTSTEPVRSTPVNCKPNFPSIMNYAFQGNSNYAFSDGTIPGVSELRPRYLQESVGLGGNTYQRAALVAEFGLTMTPTGAVDWNRDGDIGSGVTRGMPTINPNNGGNCGAGSYAIEEFSPPDGTPPRSPLNNTASGVALARIPLGNLFWVSRRETDNQLLFRTAGSVGGEGCPSGGRDSRNVAACHTAWNPPRTMDATAIPTPLQTTMTPAATGFVSSANQPHLVVFANVANTMRYVVYNGSWWSSVQTVPGDAAASGPPAAITYNGQMRVYAPYNIGTAATNGIREWIYDPASNQWSGPFLLYSPSLVPLRASDAGIGVTRGYFREPGGHLGTAVDRTVIAFPNSSDIIKLAILDAGGWTELGFSNINRTTFEAPSIAYVPYDPAYATSGRFYVSWNNRANDRTVGAHDLQFSEGNDRRATQTTRRFVWNTDPVSVLNGEQTVWGNVALMYERGIDQNLHAAWNYRDVEGQRSNLRFAPFLDDQYDAPLEDVVDRTIVRNNLGCSMFNRNACQ